MAEKLVSKSVKMISVTTSGLTFVVVLTTVDTSEGNIGDFIIVDF